VPRLQSKHPRVIRWLHWFNVPLLALMIWSGLLIYWANDVYRIGWGGIKHIKRMGTMRFTDDRPADYWAQRGYDWYSGH
jgi:hypothetical protein